MVMVLARASMLFSTNSAMAFSGLLCESAMIRMAFQSSPIRNLPFSDSFGLTAFVFATVLANSSGRMQGRDNGSVWHHAATISRGTAFGQRQLGSQHARQLSLGSIAGQQKLESSQVT